MVYLKTRKNIHKLIDMFSWLVLLKMTEEKERHTLRETLYVRPLENQVMHFK